MGWDKAFRIFVCLLSWVVLWDKWNTEDAYTLTSNLAN